MIFRFRFIPVHPGAEVNCFIHGSPTVYSAITDLLQFNAVPKFALKLIRTTSHFYLKQISLIEKLCCVRHKTFQLTDILGVYVYICRCRYSLFHLRHLYSQASHCKLWLHANKKRLHCTGILDKGTASQFCSTL